MDVNSHWKRDALITTLGYAYVLFMLFGFPILVTETKNLLWLLTLTPLAILTIFMLASTIIDGARHPGGY